MGGLLILAALTLSTLMWARLDNAYVWLVLGVTVAFGLIGFADDWAKVSRNNSKGVSGKLRLGLGFIIAAIAAVVAIGVHPDELSAQLAVPVFKDVLFNMGWLFVPFAMIVIVGSANAVNLTDGLDGLAIMPVMIAAGTLGVIAYAVGRVDFTEYLDVHYVPGTGELLIFTAGLIGGGLGFLWYNAPPAAVFMGDTGSLALGGALGAIAGRDQARNRGWPSSAVSSWPRRSASSSRWPISRPPESVSSSWRPSTIISRNRAGPSRRSSSASGSSR